MTTAHSGALLVRARARARDLLSAALPEWKMDDCHNLRRLLQHAATFSLHRRFARHLALAAAASPGAPHAHSLFMVDQNMHVMQF